MDRSDVDSWTVTTLFHQPFILARCLVAGFTRGREHGLRVVSLEDLDLQREWRTRGTITSLRAFSGDLAPDSTLWLLDGFEHRIASLSFEELLVGPIEPPRAGSAAPSAMP